MQAGRTIAAIVGCLSVLSGPAAFGGDASQAPVIIQRGSTIVTEGDSLTYGMDVSSAGVPTQINGAPQTRSITPFPETLAEQLRGCATVVNHGYPGDRSVDGLVRWQAPSHANVTILM